PLELLRRQCREPLPVERILQRREARAEGRRWQEEHPVRRRGADRNPCRPATAIQQQLRREAAERVADDDRRTVEAADDSVAVIDNLREPEPLQRRRVAAGLL